MDAFYSQLIVILTAVLIIFFGVLIYKTLYNKMNTEFQDDEQGEKETTSAGEEAKPWVRPKVQPRGVVVDNKDESEETPK